MGNNVAVIGLGFGDEGKGKVVSNYCLTHSSSLATLVVRYSGGQQAGHHVMFRDKDHVFSNFGSGTLQGVPTYWSKYCTVDPVAILTELEVMLDLGIEPKLFLDRKAPVTTRYEKNFNNYLNNITGHGTCGVGIGQTYQREEDWYSITVEDLYYPTALKIKLQLLGKYYDKKIDGNGIFNHKLIIDEIVQVAEEIQNCVNIGIVDDIPEYRNYIFEGSQGLLLDQHFGFFPHVTRSNTGTINVLKMGYKPDVLLVTRAYQTRHGNGPMTNEDIRHTIKDNPYGRNVDTGPQGIFRKSILDLDLLLYAMEKDVYVRKYRNKRVSLVVTCLDLIDDYCLTENGKLLTFANERDFINKIAIGLFINTNKVSLSRTPYPEMEIFD